MRKKLSKFALTASLVLAITLTFSLVACSGGDIPDGRYVKNRDGKYWEFSGDKATEYSREGTVYRKGTYKIDKEGLFLLTREDGSIDKLLFAQEGNKLLLGTTEYTKQ